MTATIFGIVTGIIIARVLGPEKRGYFGLVIMACTLLFTLGHLGFGSAIAYYTGKRSYDRNSILKFLVVSSLTLGMAVSIVFLFVYPYIKDIWTDIPRPVMLIGLVSVPFFFFYTFLDRFLLAVLKIRQSVYMRIFNSLFYLLMIVVFILVLKGGIKETIACYTISFIVSSVLAFLLFTREYRPMSKLDLSMTGPMFHYGIRIFLISIFNFLNYKLGVILVKHFLTVSDVSFFQIASSIAQRFWYFPNAMGALLFPTLLAMEKGSAEFSAKICRNNLFFMVLFGVVSIFTARPVIVLLYGMEYEQVTYAFLSLLFGIVVFPFYRFIAVYFASENKLGICILASVAGIVINVAANILLIPRFGVIGAGVASSISYTALSLILLIFFRYYTKIGFREILIPNIEDFRMYSRNLRKAYQRLRRRSDRNDRTDA